MNKVTISNPNPYTSTNTGKPMVSYVVTGTPEAIDAYRQYQKSQGVDSSDDEGNPLAHFNAPTAVKYGESAELIQGESKTGEEIWYMDNNEQKELEKLVSGADETTKAIYAAQKLEELKSFARTLASNRAKNIAKLKAQGSPKQTGLTDM